MPRAFGAITICGTPRALSGSPYDATHHLCIRRRTSNPRYWVNAGVEHPNECGNVHHTIGEILAPRPTPHRAGKIAQTLIGEQRRLVNGETRERAREMRPMCSDSRPYDPRSSQSRARPPPRLDAKCDCALKSIRRASAGILIACQALRNIRATIQSHSRTSISRPKPPPRALLSQRFDRKPGRMLNPRINRPLPPRTSCPSTIRAALAFP